MKVSFIIPLYNRLDLTRPCLASLQATLPAGLDHEIVLVDDGSTDGTREWIQNLGAPFRVLLNERNLGYAGANNRAAAAATGDILALLNSDLLFSRRWLEPMLAVLGDTSAASIVGNVQFQATTGALDHIGFRVGLTGKPCHDQSRLWLRAPWRQRQVPAVTAACLLLPRALFLRLRGFDEGFRNGGEDVDLCFRARALGATCLLALHSRIRHHVSASPGRKLHDEKNSRLLARRWREEFLRLNRRAVGLCWSRTYMMAHWDEPRELAPGTLAGIALFLAGFRSYPSDEAAVLHRALFRQEEERWRALLGPAPADEFLSSLP
ncbi:MAG: glycosyltransferase family 2 protein [Opitutaceae bacterium]|nr:glycosyltransferase family 2 protein [Opitutaceae bacterium]